MKLLSFLHVLTELERQRPAFTDLRKLNSLMASCDDEMNAAHQAATATLVQTLTEIESCKIKVKDDLKDTIKNHLEAKRVLSAYRDGLLHVLLLGTCLQLPNVDRQALILTSRFLVLQAMRTLPPLPLINYVLSPEDHQLLNDKNKLEILGHTANYHFRIALCRVIANVPQLRHYFKTFQERMFPTDDRNAFELIHHLLFPAMILDIVMEGQAAYQKGFDLILKTPSAISELFEVLNTLKGQLDAPIAYRLIDFGDYLFRAYGANLIDTLRTHQKNEAQYPLVKDVILPETTWKSGHQVLKTIEANLVPRQPRAKLLVSRMDTELAAMIKHSYLMRYETTGILLQGNVGLVRVALGRLKIPAPQDARYWYEKAAACGSTIAHIGLANDALLNKNYIQACHYMRSAEWSAITVDPMDGSQIKRRYRINILTGKTASDFITGMNCPEHEKPIVQYFNLTLDPESILWLNLALLVMAYPPVMALFCADDALHERWTAEPAVCRSLVNFPKNAKKELKVQFLLRMLDALEQRLDNFQTIYDPNFDDRSVFFECIRNFTMLLEHARIAKLDSTTYINYRKKLLEFHSLQIVKSADGISKNGAIGNYVLHMHLSQHITGFLMLNLSADAETVLRVLLTELREGKFAKYGPEGLVITDEIDTELRMIESLVHTCIKIIVPTTIVGNNPVHHELAAKQVLSARVSLGHMVKAAERSVMARMGFFTSNIPYEEDGALLRSMPAVLQMVKKLAIIDDAKPTPAPTPAPLPAPKAALKAEPKLAPVPVAALTQPAAQAPALVPALTPVLAPAPPSTPCIASILQPPAAPVIPDYRWKYGYLVVDGAVIPRQQRAQVLVSGIDPEEAAKNQGQEMVRRDQRESALRESAERVQVALGLLKSSYRVPETLSKLLGTFSTLLPQILNGDDTALYTLFLAIRNVCSTSENLTMSDGILSTYQAHLFNKVLTNIAAQASNHDDWVSASQRLNIIRILLLSEGLGLHKDSYIALLFAEQSANERNMMDMLALGLTHQYEGLGSRSPDGYLLPQKARKWFENAANRGSCIAHITLAKDAVIKRDFIHAGYHMRSAEWLTTIDDNFQGSRIKLLPGNNASDFITHMNCPEHEKPIAQYFNLTLDPEHISWPSLALLVMNHPTVIALFCADDALHERWTEQPLMCTTLATFPKNTKKEFHVKFLLRMLDALEQRLDNFQNIDNPRFHDELVFLECISIFQILLEHARTAKVDSATYISYRKKLLEFHTLPIVRSADATLKSGTIGNYVLHMNLSQLITGYLALNLSSDAETALRILLIELREGKFAKYGPEGLVVTDELDTELLMFEKIINLCIQIIVPQKLVEDESNNLELVTKQIISARATLGYCVQAAERNAVQRMAFFSPNIPYEEDGTLLRSMPAVLQVVKKLATSDDAKPAPIPAPVVTPPPSQAESFITSAPALFSAPTPAMTPAPALSDQPPSPPVKIRFRGIDQQSTKEREDNQKEIDRVTDSMFDL
jgi:TPR repeat protein